MADSDKNSLDFLIPTGANDFAVQELLVKIFGDAVACKVPGMACGDTSIHTGGALVSSAMAVFNSGTLIFVTILLIFIALIGFTKTAIDGEFLGKSWNTTFTALRLVAGIGFLLPMPNGYSSIQNFALYVGLWSSGLGNLTSDAVADHYLKRLQASMVAREPSSTSLNTELRQLFSMQLCAKYLNAQYPTSNLTLRSLTIGAGDIKKTEWAYIENGTYHPPNAAPCGRFVIDSFKPAVVSSVEAQKDGPIFATIFGNNLTSAARKEMLKISEETSTAIRVMKTELLKESLEPNSLTGQLADKIIAIFRAGMIIYDDDGNIVSVPGKELISVAQAKELITTLALIQAKKQEALTAAVVGAQARVSDATNDSSSNGFLSNTKKMLTDGGWMSMASTYRTMMDLVSIRFNKSNDSPYKIIRPNQSELLFYSEYGANAMGMQIANLNTLIDRILDSDTAKTEFNKIVNGGTQAGEANAAIEPPKITYETLKEIATSDASPSEAMHKIYGGSFTNGFRNMIVKSMALDTDEDPLFQIKSMGDFITGTAEVLVMGEIAARTAIATADTIAAAASGNIIGRAANAVTGVGDTYKSFSDGIKYVLEGVFTTLKSMTMVLLALGYLFSTWLPATPYVAFLMAQLGWLFGLVMTLFALNIWGVMHVTPARNDSFIGSEAQGYLLMVALFFRPAIATAALALSHVIAPPVIKLVNITLIPMMYVTNSSSNMLSIMFGTLFCLILYFSIIKGVLVMIYTIPQSFPDEVMRVISAGIGDLGQSKSMGEMGAGGGAAAVGIQTASRMEEAGGKHLKATMEDRRNRAQTEANAAAANGEGIQPSGDRPSDIAGSGPRSPSNSTRGQ